MAVRHIFLWSIKEGHDADRVLEVLVDLTLKAPGVLNWSAGKHVGATPNKWQYGLTTDLEDLEAFGAFAQAPEQVAALGEIASSYDDFASVEYELT